MLSVGNFSVILRGRAVNAVNSLLIQTESPLDEEALLFSNLKGLARSVAQTFGRNCEVVIHDFRDFERSIIHIEGDVTNRKLGAPITNLVLKAWRNEGDAVKDFINYSSTTKSGRALKCSTSFVRNSAGKVIGAMCINYDIVELENCMRSLQDMVRVDAQEQSSVTETFATYLGETSEAVIEGAVREVGKHPANMSRKERLEFIRMLDKNGAFLIKGVVHQLARVLNVSIYTVYNYMRQVKQQNGSKDVES